MKRFMSSHPILLIFAIMMFFASKATSQSSVVAPANAEFIEETAANPFSDPEGEAKIRQNYYNQMNPVIPVDPAVLAAQAAAKAQAEAAQKAQNAALLQAGLQAGIQACTTLLNSNSQTDGFSTLSNTIRAQEYNNVSEPTYLPNLKKERATRIGSDANLTFSKGCNNFITKDGQLGQWGRWAQKLIKNEPSLVDKIPKDFDELCPNLPRGTSEEDKDARTMFYVWILASMASSESQCNPRALNPKRSPSHPHGPPNGDALGLFQLWGGSCNPSIYPNLYDPGQNIECAVDVLAKEMQKPKRQNLITPVSNTYWGTLRGNPAGVDAGAAASTESLIRKFSMCQ